MGARLAVASRPVRRLAHGGHVDLNLSSDGRVLLLVNCGADVSQVLCELDAVREAPVG